MKALLDTHTIMWFMLGDNKLSKTAFDIMQDQSNAFLVSPASHWEMAIKISIGKYFITDDFQKMWQEVFDRFDALQIDPAHTARLLTLPMHHKDPFDRCLSPSHWLKAFR